MSIKIANIGPTPVLLSVIQIFSESCSCCGGNNESKLTTPPQAAEGRDGRTSKTKDKNTVLQK